MLLTGLTLTFFLNGCGLRDETASDTAPMTERTLLAGGSSTLYPVTREAARRFQREQRGADIRVTYGGSTEGFRQFCTGTLDLANASRAINPEERQACADAGIDYLELPVAIDTLAVVTHVDNDWVDHLTVAELKKIWEPSAQGRITDWNQVRPDWPARPMTLYGRGADSGTYDYFTRVITGTTRASRDDYRASEDEEWLAEAIASDPDSLGFFGIGAYHRHWESLRVIAIDSGEGPVYPSVESASEGRYRPLSRPLYLYVSHRSLQENADLGAFLDSYFADARRWLHLTGYLPLDADRYAESRRRLQQH